MSSPRDPAGFARLLRAARANTSQAQLAKAAGLQRSLISELEHCRTPIRRQHVRRLCAALALDETTREDWLSYAVRTDADTGRPGAPRRFGPLDDQSFAVAYAARRRIKEIAAEAGAPVATVKQSLRRAGVPIRRDGLYLAVDPAILAAAIRDYQERGDWRAVCRRHQIGKSTLYAALQRQGIPTVKRRSRRRR